MIHLGVNIDHIATVRQARYRQAGRTHGSNIEPDPIRLAREAESGGADGITAHLREDCRHMQPADLRRLKESIRTRLNMEMACTSEMTAFALELKPEFACLVPENREEVTTEGGLDVAGQRQRVGEVVRTLTGEGIKTSLFIDPDPEQVEAAAELKSPFIELHTGAFANVWYVSREDTEKELARLRRACELGRELGLTVNAGHGINYENIRDIRALPYLYELNIGHSIVSRALLIGMSEAVREMKASMNP